MEFPYFCHAFWSNQHSLQAVSERESAMRAAQLSYTDAPIHVEIVQASDLQKASGAPTGDLTLPCNVRVTMSVTMLSYD